VANHFRLDFNLIEGLAVVDANNAPNHLGNYDHVAKVGTDWFWLLTRWCLPFLIQNIMINVLLEYGMKLVKELKFHKKQKQRSKIAPTYHNTISNSKQRTF
jgi:hypothetical protein